MNEIKFVSRRPINKYSVALLSINPEFQKDVTSIWIKYGMLEPGDSFHDGLQRLKEYEGGLDDPDHIYNHIEKLMLKFSIPHAWKHTLFTFLLQGGWPQDLADPEGLAIETDFSEFRLGESDYDKLDVLGVKLILGANTTLEAVQQAWADHVQPNLKKMKNARVVELPNFERDIRVFELSFFFKRSPLQIQSVIDDEFNQELSIQDIKNIIRQYTRRYEQLFKT